MRRRLWHRRIHISWGKIWIFITFAALLFLLNSGYRRLEELVALYGENRCRNLVTQMLLDAVSETENGEKLSTFTMVDNKSVLQLNSTAVRQYHATVGKYLTQRLDRLREE